MDNEAKKEELLPLPLSQQLPCKIHIRQELEKGLPAGMSKAEFGRAAAKL